MFNKKFFSDLLVLLVIAAVLTPFITKGISSLQSSFAASREASYPEATPSMAYGNYNGTIKKINLDSNGNVIISSTSSGNLSINNLVANVVNATTANITNLTAGTVTTSGNGASTFPKGLQVGQNGVSGTAGVLSIADGDNPGTVANVSYDATKINFTKGISIPSGNIIYGGVYYRDYVNATTSNAGNTVTLKSIPIGGNLLGPLGAFRVTSSWTMTNTSNANSPNANKTITMSYNGEQVFSSNVSTTAPGSVYQPSTVVVYNCNSNSVQHTLGSMSGASTSASSMKVLGVDTTQSANVDLKCKVYDANESCTLDNVMIEILRP